MAGGALSVVGGLVLIGVESALTGATGTDSEPPVVLLLAIVGLLGRGVHEIAGWWFRTYQVTGDRLVVDEGVLTRHHRVVPFERVQQIDVSQTLVAQALGLAVLRVDTAGESGATTVHLRWLDRRRADGLRTWVLHRRAALHAARAAAPAGASAPGADRSDGAVWSAPVGHPAPPPPERTVLALTPTQLAVAGLAGPLGTAVVVLALLAVVAGMATAIAEGAAVGAGVAGTGVVLTAGLAVLGTISGVLSLWDLRIDLVGDDLRLRHGLFQVRSLTIPRRRVQHVSVVETPLQRAIGVVSVTLHSAASGTAHVEGGRAVVASAFTIPSLRRARTAAVLHELLGGDWQVPSTTPRGPAAHRRAIVRRSALGALVGALALLAGPEGVLVVVATGALGALWGIDAHRRAGWAETPTLVVLAHGSLVHRTELVPVGRVQSARTTSSPLQRRAGVATTHLDVAGRHAPHLYDVDRDVAERLRRATPRRGVEMAR